MTWSVSTSNDLGIKILNYREQLLWSKTINLGEYNSSIAATTFLMEIKYRSLYGKYVVIRPVINSIEYTDVGCGYSGTFTISDTVIPASKTYADTLLNIALYGSGDGLMTEAAYMRCFYFNARRITPADFGVSEMILIDGRLDAGTVIIFDDNPLQFIMNPDDAEDAFSFDMSRAQRETLVRSVTIVKGRADLSFHAW
ncbi:MAG: hypothetical protein QW761_00250 [Candidatus Aenigmatarchaeota archaeon]